MVLPPVPHDAVIPRPGSEYGDQLLYYHYMAGLTCRGISNPESSNEEAGRVELCLKRLGVRPSLIGTIINLIRE